MVVAEGRTTSEPLTTTSSARPVEPSVSVARSALVVVHTRLTSLPGETCPGIASAASTASSGRSVMAMPRVASMPFSFVARSVNVPEADGTTVTGLPCTMPGAGSMRTVLAPRTANENVTGAPTSGLASSTAKLSFTGGPLEHATAAMVTSRKNLMAVRRTSPAARSDRRHQSCSWRQSGPPATGRPRSTASR